MKTIDGFDSTLDRILKGSDNRDCICFPFIYQQKSNPDFTKLISFVINPYRNEFGFHTLKVPKTQFPKGATTAWDGMPSRSWGSWKAGYSMT